MSLDINGRGTAGAGIGTRIAAGGCEVDWVRVPVVRGEKVEAEVYVGRRDGKMMIGVRGRF